MEQQNGVGFVSLCSNQAIRESTRQRVNGDASPTSTPDFVNYSNNPLLPQPSRTSISVGHTITVSNLPIPHGRSPGRRPAAHGSRKLLVASPARLAPMPGTGASKMGNMFASNNVPIRPDAVAGPSSVTSPKVNSRPRPILPAPVLPNSTMVDLQCPILSCGHMFSANLTKTHEVCIVPCARCGSAITAKRPREVVEEPPLNPPHAMPSSSGRKGSGKNRATGNRGSGRNRSPRMTEARTPNGGLRPIAPSGGSPVVSIEIPLKKVVESTPSDPCPRAGPVIMCHSASSPAMRIVKMGSPSPLLSMKDLVTDPVLVRAHPRSPSTKRQLKRKPINDKADLLDSLNAHCSTTQSTPTPSKVLRKDAVEEITLSSDEEESFEMEGEGDVESANTSVVHPPAASDQPEDDALSEATVPYGADTGLFSDISSTEGSPVRPTTITARTPLNIRMPLRPAPGAVANDMGAPSSSEQTAAQVEMSALYSSSVSVENPQTSTQGAATANDDLFSPLGTQDGSMQVRTPVAAPGGLDGDQSSGSSVQVLSPSKKIVEYPDSDCDGEPCAIPKSPDCSIVATVASSLPSTPKASFSGLPTTQRLLTSPIIGSTEPSSPILISSRSTSRSSGTGTPTLSIRADLKPGKLRWNSVPPRSVHGILQRHVTKALATVAKASSAPGTPRMESIRCMTSTPDAVPDPGPSTSAAALSLPASPAPDLQFATEYFRINRYRLPCGAVTLRKTSVTFRLRMTDQPDLSMSTDLTLDYDKDVERIEYCATPKQPANRAIVLTPSQAGFAKVLQLPGFYAMEPVIHSTDGNPDLFGVLLPSDSEVCPTALSRVKKVLEWTSAQQGPPAIEDITPLEMNRRWKRLSHGPMVEKSVDDHLRSCNVHIFRDEKFTVGSITSAGPSNVPRQPVRLFMYPLPPKHAGGITVNDLDMEGLKDGECLNDTIIDFYFKYIFNELMSEEHRKSVYIYNTFFWTKVKGIYDNSSGSTTHSGVAKWTKGVDIFAKDFLVVPINEDLHWYLAVICFPGLDPPPRDQNQIVDTENLNDWESSYTPPLSTRLSMKFPPLQIPFNAPTTQPQASETESDEYVRKPCIFVIDSLWTLEVKDAVTYKNTVREKQAVRVLRSYLAEEWEAKKGGQRPCDAVTMPKQCPYVPQQQNASDCGLFVLQFAQSFVQNPAKVFNAGDGGLPNWFTLCDVGKMRAEIRRVVAQMTQLYKNLPRRKAVQKKGK